MNENLKIEETVEYHIYELPEGDDFPVYVTFDFSTALSAYRSGSCVIYEIHITQYSSEWAGAEHKYHYEWHES